MNLLIDLNHACHVHLFKHFYFKMVEKGHRVTVTTKNIKAVIQLLRNYDIPFQIIGNKPEGLLRKILYQVYFDLKLARIVKRNNIAIGIGVSISVPQVSKITAMKSIMFEDDDKSVVPLSSKFAHPFADLIVSPDVLASERKGNKYISYPGYHELAYLHPKRFVPDENVLYESGLTMGETYFVLRFNAFKAHHDIGAQGLSLDDKRRLVGLLKPHGKVFISTESEIDPEFQCYQLTVSPDKIHSLLYYATMFIGDSQTMTSEAAVLGTPAIRCNSFVGRISYLEEEEHRYGLTFGFRPDQKELMYARIEEFLALPELKEEWQRRRMKMLADKIDVTAFMIWFVDKFPESEKLLREDPKYYSKFK
jgi:predicted glycosyltransferase